jgi:hypothetical protein
MNFKITGYISNNYKMINSNLINFNLYIRNQKIKVDYWNEEVEIIGIDEFGFLKVKKRDNTEHLLQPDGNRYDMMHNLIVFRT